MEKRLREELAKLQVEVNEDKSRKVDLQRGESFGFLGFEFRRIRSRRGRWMPLLLPKGKKRTALLAQAQGDFPGLSVPAGGRGDRKDQSDPARLGEILRDRPLESVFLIYPNWVEKKIRRHLARACQRQASAGSGGAGNGCTARWGSSRSTAYRMGRRTRQSLQSDRSHNP